MMAHDETFVTRPPAHHNQALLWTRQASHRSLGLSAVLLAIAVVSSGCANVPPISSGAPSGATTPPLTPTQSTARLTGPAVSAPIPLPECHESDPCTGLAPGTYVLAGEGAFMAGLIVTIPEPWTNGEQDIGEFSVVLPQIGGDGRRLFFVKDITPVRHDGTRERGLPRTSAALIDWLRRNPDFVTSDPERATIGLAIPATTMLLGVSESAKNADPDCPVEACVGVFTADGWPQDGIGYAIGRQPEPLYLRMYFMDLMTGLVPHTLVVVLDAGGTGGLRAFQGLADAVLGSVVLPVGTRPA